MLSAADVRVNGEILPKGALVRAGDEVVVRALAEPALEPVHVPLRILYRDKRLVAVDKPPGVPSTGRVGGALSIASMLLASFPEMSAIDTRRDAGLVHRLDTGTSGVLLAARRADAYRELRQAFARKEVEKVYLAVVRGRVDAAGTIDLPLAHHPRSRRRMIPARGTRRPSWPALTVFRPLRHASDATLIELRMRSGVTHQLRVHLAVLGHPILGDTLYGPRGARGTAGQESPSEAVRDSRGDARSGWHYLHAMALHFDRLKLPPALRAPFPRHWARLFRDYGWPAGKSALAERRRNGERRRG